MKFFLIRHKDGRFHMGSSWAGSRWATKSNNMTKLYSSREEVDNFLQRGLDYGHVNLEDVEIVEVIF
jgi:hypothetical protein